MVNIQNATHVYSHTLSPESFKVEFLNLLQTNQNKFAKEALRLSA
jgi:hypothetical protein